MSDMYILSEDGKTPIPCEDPLTLACWREKAKRHVALNTIGKVTVSTVFLGLDHRFGQGSPLLWESMIFGGPFDQEQERYSSYADAVAGHAILLKKVQGAPDALVPKCSQMIR